MKLGKRITALALSACMLLGVAFVPTQAQEAGNGSGHRGDAYNNGITTAKTPVAKEETGLLWATKLGGQYEYAGPPMYANGSIYTYWGNKIYKLNRNTGEKEAEGTIDIDTSKNESSAFDWSYFPVTYGDGKIYVGLKNKIQAFDADTLESEWINEKLTGNPDSPITYKDKKIYMGFDSGAFVCLSSENGEEKWKSDSTDGSFYWSGAAVVGDYVVYTNKNGSVISRNKDTGDFGQKYPFSNSDITTSSVCYDNGKIYFMTGKISLIVADFDSASGKFSNLKSIDCSSYGANSKGTPVVYNGIVYVGVGNWRGGKILAINPTKEENEIIWNKDITAYPDCSILLSNAYKNDGFIYLYTTYSNKNPEGIDVIKVKEDGTSPESYNLFGNEEKYGGYCSSSIVADENGTLYYHNNSGYVMAVASKNTIDNLPAATEVEKKIAALPSEEEIRLDNESAISEARKAYDELTEAQKELVNKDRLQALEKAEAKINSLKKEEADKEAAATVVKQINELGEIALTKEEQVKAARAAYDALTEAQKALVSEEQVQTLEKAEAEINELKEAKSNQEAADAVISQIEELAKGTIDLTKEAQVKEVRVAYEKLTDEQKKLVNNLSILEKAEQTVKDLKAAQSSGTKGNTDTKPDVASTAGKTNTTKANPVVKEGMTVKTDSGKEYVKILSTTKKRVAYVKPAKKTYKNVAVSATVNVSGEKYKVVAVSAGAFKKMPKLQKVTLGNNVEEIGAKAFCKCKKLKKVVITSKKLTGRKVSTKAFSGTNKKITVKVPKKKYKVYKKFLAKSGNKTIRIKK